MGKIKPQALLQQSKKKKGPRSISVTTIVLYGVLVVLLVVFVLTLYRHFTQRSRVQLKEGLPIHKNLGAYGGSKKSDLPKYAVFNTSKGMIVVELYKEGAPDAIVEFVDAWYQLLQFGSYKSSELQNAFQMGQFKGMQFHRVIKNFVIQGGDFENGIIEDWTSKGKHYNQLDTSVKHEAFMMCTSKGKHDKEGFELFITTTPIPNLNEKLNVLGRVIRGENVVQEIEEVETDEHYRPKAWIGIIDVTLEQKI